MVRKILIDSRVHPYHLTARANNREHFPGKPSYLWKVFTDELYLQSHLYSLRVHAFVLMPNHFHMIATPTDLSIDVTMKLFIGSVTRTINSKYQRWGRVFGGRYHWSLIRDPLYYAHAVKYVYRNPVKANLAEVVEGYPFSTYAGLVGRNRLPVSIDSPHGGLDRYMFNGASHMGDLSGWLNTPNRKEVEDAIRLGLKSKTFELPVKRGTRTKIELEVPNF
jgi:putative transposase